jgi:histidinol-phosphate aminotransferase
MMSKYWSDIVRNIEPYVPGEQPRDRKYIKLNTNENPYPPSPNVLKAVKDSGNESLRLYPDPSCEELRKTIGQYFNLNKERIFVGNGSDELLAFSFMAFFKKGKPVLFPDITYSFYPVYAALFSIGYRLVPLDKEFSMSASMFHGDNGGIIFPNPNAPTGKHMPVHSIKSILEHNKDNVVIIDEAYVDFGGESAMGLIGQYPNLLVIQTFSKSRSLAGLRIGFAAGHEDLIEGLDRIKNSINSYTLDRVALNAAEAAIKDEEYFQETRCRVIDTRERVSVELRRMGFNVIDSRANFLFISHPVLKATMLFKRLKEKGILVRYFNKPRIDNFLRVSIGTDQEMDCFLASLADIIGKEN